MTARNRIGVVRTLADGTIDQRCTACVDFWADADPVYEGEPLHCTYCGDKWANKSKLRSELDKLERDYSQTWAITWAQYVEGMRDLYRRATIAGDDVAGEISSWAESLDSDSPELPPLLAGALDSESEPKAQDAQHYGAAAIMAAAKDIGEGWRKAVITLAAGDSADVPDSAKYRYQGSGEITYYIHATGWNVSLGEGITRRPYVRAS